MAPFLYNCPVTGQVVQGWVADDGDDRARTMKCLACSRFHLINPKTGEVLGETDK